MQSFGTEGRKNEKHHHVLSSSSFIIAAYVVSSRGKITTVSYLYVIATAHSLTKNK